MTSNQMNKANARKMMATSRRWARKGGRKFDSTRSRPKRQGRRKSMILTEPRDVVNHRS